MVATDPAQTISTDEGREMRTGGAILFSGVLLFVITIGLELMVGWHTPGSETALADMADLILQKWDTLRWIWTAQMFAAFLLGLSALLLLRIRRRPGRWFSTSAVWAMVAIGGILLTVAYGFTLGAYPPALEAFQQSPEIFATVRGGVRFILEVGLLVTWFGYLVLFIGEGVAKEGAVPRSWVVGAVVVIGLAILAAAAGLVRASTVGAVGNLIPGLLGLALWRAGRRQHVGG